MRMTSTRLSKACVAAWVTVSLGCSDSERFEWPPAENISGPEADLVLARWEQGLASPPSTEAFEAMSRVAADHLGYTPASFQYVGLEARWLGSRTAMIDTGTRIVVLEQRSGEWQVSRSYQTAPECWGPATDEPVEIGAIAFIKKGCNQCHSTSRDDLPTGPALGGIYGTERELRDGSTAIADDDYLRATLTDPDRVTLKGWNPLMPPYGDRLEDFEVDALVEYMKSLSTGD